MIDQPPRSEKINTLHKIETKWALEFTVRVGYSMNQNQNDIYFSPITCLHY